MSDRLQISRQIAPTPILAARGILPEPIPRPLTSFLARERERAELSTLILQDDTQLVTLVGPAGVGKTRLAIQLTTELGSAFAATAFASLAAARLPDQIAPVAGEALGIRDPTIERIAEQLRSGSVLLVLDNLEQIPGAAAVVAQLLAVCPSLTIIATSRTVLRVSNERVYPVLPLAVDPAPAGELDQVAAVQLFTARARAADPSFSLDETTLATVARVCQQVDGLPLAIELAAGQMRLLTPQSLLSRLDRRLDLLTHGPMDQPERQQSLDRAVRWSYDLLAPGEQQFFRRLGVFSGGFTEEAAREIARPEGRAALVALGRAIDASLLIRHVQPDGESRYVMLETIREFCLREIDAHGEEPAIRQAHAAYYLQLAARAEPHLMPPDSAGWAQRLALEHANLRDAVEWSLANNEPNSVLALAGSVLSMARARSEPAESRSWLERAIAQAQPSDSPLVCDALFTASILAQVQGDFARSVEHAAQSLTIAQAAGHAVGEGRALLSLGISAEWENQLDLAEHRYRAAHSIMQNLDPAPHLTHWRPLPVANLADIALIRKNYRAAIDLGSEALTAWREASYSWGIAQALGAVAAARCELDDLEGARRDYRETLERWIACADARGIAGTVAGIASVAARSGDLTAAATLLGCTWGARETLGLDVVAHHFYAAQVRAAVLERPGTPPELLAVELAARSLPLEEAIGAAALVLVHEPRLHRPSHVTLTPREQEVLACIMSGLHDREIGEQLCISPRTVQSHVLGILNKLGARSRAEAVAIALRRDSH